MKLTVFRKINVRTLFSLFQRFAVASPYISVLSAMSKIEVTPFLVRFSGCGDSRIRKGRAYYAHPLDANDILCLLASVART